MWCCREQDPVPKVKKNSVREKHVFMRDEMVQKRKRYNQFLHNGDSECCAKKLSLFPVGNI